MLLAMLLAMCCGIAVCSLDQLRCELRPMEFTAMQQRCYAQLKCELNMIVCLGLH